MVNVGELQITGDMDTNNIDQGFDRVDQDFKNLENQANQTNASMGTLASTASTLGKRLGVAGIAGLTAMTALAGKAPVLAGTMAKIDVETLKLSNTIGRQLKPAFDEIAQNLIPSINQAFVDNAESIQTTTGRIEGLIGSVSALIRLDWEDLIDNLDKVVAPKNLPDLAEGETRSPFAETQQRFSNIVQDPPEYQNDWQTFQYQIGFLKNIVALPFNAIIDTIQWSTANTETKTAELVSATGVIR